MVEVIGDIVVPSELILPFRTSNPPLKNGAMFMSGGYVYYVSGGAVYYLAAGTAG